MNATPMHIQPLDHVRAKAWHFILIIFLHHQNIRIRHFLRAKYVGRVCNVKFRPPRINYQTTHKC